MGTQELIQILEDQETGYFYDVAQELSKRPEEAALIAPVLAKALSYPRRDSYEAGVFLIGMGEAAKPAIPHLFSNLTHEREVVRQYSALALGRIGEAAECAIPVLASLLWDTDPAVRTASASALKSITRINVIQEIYNFDPEKPRGIYQDIPEGNITGSAREWWKLEGQYINWSTNSDNCRPKLD
ncbi:MAG: HEAT repeat domain-containing protein [Anaerolineales bacterium]|nr:HEAT repeat domain-containing protein [Anaerolineales bacterium]